jgi:hypothetical protein
VVATDKETGAIVWDKSLLDQADLELTAAPLALKDSIVIGGSGGDRGLRNWVAALDPKTGDMQWKTYSIPAPGEPGSETWKDNHGAWQTYLAVSVIDLQLLAPWFAIHGSCCSMSRLPSWMPRLHSRSNNALRLGAVTGW